MASTWKRDFASGLIVITPLLVTVMVLLWLYNRLEGIPLPVEPAPLRVGLTIVVFILLVFAVGYLMRTAVGSIVEDAIDDLMNQLPGLRVVYNASKMAAETALSGTDELQAPVKLETWDGMRMTAFLTGKTTEDGRDVLFLPTAPNITTGFVVEVEPDRYTEIDERVEDALTRILSAGFGESDEKSIQVDVEDVVSEVGGSPDGERDAD
ncbi:protein of unknown function DUF502 [Halorhabdus utahensis DSM 12940]|uniref:DUF502 domain-containing protein n=1 Tax=Halorhabdus utahensis (strain DSM 12940 / JCM 11049 / AX-2) TaxID=519442 RepID=C7NTJ8_HALUD|nr:DUF502 domain-containing protein [Halorhabdus utahensis]ACV12188.1 protein of unknown function DUF502 [Halorhabdus utahensis DSM 12940]